MAGIQVDGANQKLVLDSDGDTYLEAATDDTIKAYVAGAHDATISANAINVLSGTTLTIDSGATITNSGTASGFGSNVPSSADGQALGSASAEWSDLFLADGGIIKFGNDQDTLLTHTDGTGLTLNSTNKLCFNDASQFVQGSSATVLSIGATDEIDLTATAVDLNGTLDVSGNSQFSGTITVGVDDTGKDVKLFGATSGSYLEWDESADDLNLIASGIGVIAAKDLGQGIHIKASDSGGSAASNEADFLIIEKNSDVGMQFLSATNASANIYFGDSGDNNIGFIRYDHNANNMQFTTNTAEGMRIDSAGHVTKPLQPAFLATKSGHQADVAINATTTVIFDTEVFDNNADYNTGTYTFTAPVTGRYQFNALINWNSWDTDFGYVWHRITASNRVIFANLCGGNNVAADGYFDASSSVLVDMDANDTCKFEVQFSNDGAAQADLQQSSWFSGYLVC